MSIEPDAVSIKVVARFRPFNEKELAINAASTFKFIGDECVNINVCVFSALILEFYLN